MLIDEQEPFLTRLLQGEPLEHILKEGHFFTSRFYINEHVLIPRNETEILVEDALNLIKEKGYTTFADIGTGSGCVALSILCESKNPLSGFATDISSEALEVCRINLFWHQKRLSSHSSLTLAQGDRLEPLTEAVDLIVTNPPYIDWDNDRKDVHFQTDRYEPKLALYLSSAEYEEWFEDFFKSAYDKLNLGGALLMEGHENKLEALKSIANKSFSRVSVTKDYTGADRFLRAFKEE